MSSDPKGPEPTPLSAELERAISARLLERPPTDPDEFSEFVAHVRAQLGYKDATLDAQATEIAALRGALEHWVCRAHRAGEQGEHQAGNPDCDYARRVLGQQA